MKRSGIYELQLFKRTPNLKSDQNFESERLSNGQKGTGHVDSVELTDSPEGHRYRSPAATAELRRRLTRKLAGGDGGAAAEDGGSAAEDGGESGGDDFWRRVDVTRSDGETCRGACGLIRAPIAAQSAATASSRREEHDDGLGCTRFATVKKLWPIY
ncbi:hypothetical protein F2Q68_00020172 [Brassica cretica]|uniref:Uncharacterized protein n=1 Tax=Brassica cretica TaxID=69181 RepID=A0A8S9FZ57_BRACR|nr:hypothetical protein F2Q68_00020172 [Brassica cretica]